MLLTWRDPIKGQECATASSPPTILRSDSFLGGMVGYPHAGTVPLEIAIGVIVKNT